MTVIHCASEAAYPSTIVQLLAGSSCPQVQQALQDCGIGISGASVQREVRCRPVQSLHGWP